MKPRIKTIGTIYTTTHGKDGTEYPVVTDYIICVSFITFEITFNHKYWVTEEEYINLAMDYMRRAVRENTITDILKKD